MGLQGSENQIQPRKVTFHSCRICGAFPGVSSPPVTCCPQSHRRFQDQDLRSPCLPAELWEKGPSTVQLPAWICRSSGQHLPRALRGKRSSQVAFLPTRKEREAQQDFWGTGQSLWSLKVELVPEQSLARALSVPQTHPNPSSC